MGVRRPTLWLLEDDSGIQFVFEEVLGDGHDLTTIRSLAELTARLAGLPPGPPPIDLLVADLRLPDGSFVTFLRSAQGAKLQGIPFLVVSSLDDADVLRSCYDKGAVDYIVKPFRRAELQVKIERCLSFRSPRLDPASLTIVFAGRRSPPLTSKEFQIVAALAQARGDGLAREALLAQIWSDTHVVAKTLDVHLSNLRRKLAGIGVDVRSRGPEEPLVLSYGVDE